MQAQILLATAFAADLSELRADDAAATCGARRISVRLAGEQAPGRVVVMVVTENVMAVEVVVSVV